MISGLNKLRFKVVSYSSEDADYPASQLNTVNPNTRGWQSVRFCPYPQELGFELLDGEVHMSQVQLLSHQSKISTKIEIFIGQGPNYKSATFTRLGYLSLDSNERSSFQARELKTVFIDHVGSFIKLLINPNYVNKQNIYNQVGIIAISLMGTDDHIALPKNDTRLPISNNGYKSGPNANISNHNPYNDLSVDLNLDPNTASKLRQLSDAKSRAVENEDYLTAKQIKNVEQELKALGSKLAQLDMAKSDAVMAEDYDLAKEIKDETDQLKSKIEDKIMRINIPGVTFSKPTPVRALPISKFAPEIEYKQQTPINSARGNISPNRNDNYTMKGNDYKNNMSNMSYEDNNNYNNYEEEDDLPPIERPIRVKNGLAFDPTMGGIDDDPNSFKNGTSNSARAMEHFPPGEHPLEGVPNFLDLPSPESLAGKSREISDTSGITSLLGDYRSRALFSKTFSLREAAIIKVQLMLAMEFNRDINSHIATLCHIIKVGVEDKIQQVLTMSISLMDAVLKSAKNANISKSVLTPMFDPIIIQLIEKLSDGNQRIRDGSRKGLEILAASTCIGPGLVAHYGVKALSPKQKTAWRPIAARLQLLYDLVVTYGIGGNTGMHVDSILSFPKSHGAYTHSTAEVRDDAKKLVVAIQKCAGTSAIESVLKLLRPKQADEYQQAFDGNDVKTGPTNSNITTNNNKIIGGGTNSNAPSKDSNTKKDIQESPSRTDKHLQHAPHMPGGKVQTSAAKVANHGNKSHSNSSGSGVKGTGTSTNSQDTTNEDQQDFTSCMFCGVRDKNWTENDLDVHYWKDCPLLISCPSCAQIVEVAGLPEHLLDECDAKDSYIPCETTGLAIKSNEFDAWRKSTNCTQAPNNCMYCPLCLASVEDSDDAWLNHLTNGCPRNTRTNEAEYKDMISIFLIIVGCLLIIYFALFTGSKTSPISTSVHYSDEVTNEIKDESNINESETIIKSATKASPSKTPKKRINKKKTQEELGHVISPDGRRSIRIKTRTPKKFDDDE